MISDVQNCIYSMRMLLLLLLLYTFTTCYHRLCLASPVCYQKVQNILCKSDCTSSYSMHDMAQLLILRPFQRYFFVKYNNSLLKSDPHKRFRLPLHFSKYILKWITRLWPEMQNSFFKCRNSKLKCLSLLRTEIHRHCNRLYAPVFVFFFHSMELKLLLKLITQLIAADEINFCST